MSTNHEKSAASPEREHNNKELEAIAAEQQERLKNQLERAGEKSHENDIDSIRHEARESAQSLEKDKDRHELTVDASPSERRNNRPTAAAEDRSFEIKMQEVRQHMSPTSRSFSKLIHNKTIEKVSDTAASTVARPNALLCGAIAAFVITLSYYLLAKNLGYELSGFETIGAFILGWIIGTTYDFLRVMITGKAA